MVVTLKLLLNQSAHHLYCINRLVTKATSKMSSYSLFWTEKHIIYINRMFLFLNKLYLHK